MCKVVNCNFKCCPPCYYKEDPKIKEKISKHVSFKTYGDDYEGIDKYFFIDCCSIIFFTKYVRPFHFFGLTDLREGIKNGNMEAVIYHTEMESKLDDEYTPLQLASELGHIEIVKYLVEKVKL